jgi:hypothetical protein
MASTVWKNPPQKTSGGPPRGASSPTCVSDSRPSSFIDAIAALKDMLVAAFGPQHGLRGDKQDNMIESRDFNDPLHGIPVFSLYGEVRRPTAEMMESFDVLLIDLQDVGCRVYTFITTLRYVLESAAEHGKSIWVLDRPNPVGRRVEGLLLKPGWESFVGAGPMRHGLTLGEMGKWLVRELHLDVECEVITMDGWKPENAPGYGWPLGERAWVNPSPNASNLWMARCYGGTVMLEGTTLSEGRGTTHPLELFGAPDLEPRALLPDGIAAPQWTRLPPADCWFDLRFTNAAKLQGVKSMQQIYDHMTTPRGRLIALALKSLRSLRSDYDLWRDFPYEYEHDRLAIDLINGGDFLRRWVDDSAATPADLDFAAAADEAAWLDEREPVLLYR